MPLINTTVSQILGIIFLGLLPILSLAQSIGEVNPSIPISIDHAKSIISDADLDCDDLSINIFPNPAINTATIYLKSISNQQVNIHLLDSYHQVMYTTTTDLQEATERHLSIDTSNYNNGVYFLFVEWNDTAIVKQLVKY